MAKGGKQKGYKNVFKVAGSRSLKAKNKAKAVTTHLKKLSEVTKQRTVEVDNLLNELQETVRQTVPQKPATTTVKNEINKQDKIEQYNKAEESSIHALDKLSKMEV